ncbi:PTS system mannitol-specific EIICBA component [Geobacillus sp. BCO2]|nr:PTS system mannitol-specific EIICBA component [Geobacillus sp. BCO2]
MAKQSAPGAVIIHFLGGIHEIYFPYILMRPILILAAMAGGVSGVFTFTILNAGLVAVPSPGSIFALLAMTPKGNYFGVLAGVFVAASVSFLVASVFLKSAKQKEEEEDLVKAAEKMEQLKGKKSQAAVALQQQEEVAAVVAEQAVPVRVKKIVFACDAGMGSSAMGRRFCATKCKKPASISK